MYTTLSRYSCHFLIAFLYVEDVYKHWSRFHTNRKYLSDTIIKQNPSNYYMPHSHGITFEFKTVFINLTKLS